VTKNMGGYDV